MADGTWTTPHSKEGRGEDSGRWMTPRLVLDEVLALAGVLGLPTRFGLDVAADPGSSVADLWYGPMNMDAQRRDALADVSWAPPPRTLAWLNPPYNQIKGFTAKAAAHTGPGTLFLLTFARIDVRWFYENVAPHTTGLWFRQGRITFVDPLTGAPAQTAPTPSMLTTFGPPLPPDRLRAAATVGPWHLFAPPRLL